MLEAPSTVRSANTVSSGVAGTSEAPSSSSSISMGMIGGIVGGIVAVMLQQSTRVLCL